MARVLEIDPTSLDPNKTVGVLSFPGVDTAVTSVTVGAV